VKGWKKRLKKEYRQLDSRHHKLAQYLESPEAVDLSIHLHGLLSRQSEIMGMYLQVLGERIDYLKEDS
jgi:poly-D-alanine transfer protein DltD